MNVVCQNRLVFVTRKNKLPVSSASKARNDQLARDRPRITRSLLPQSPVAIKNKGYCRPNQSITCSVRPGSAMLQLRPDAGNHCNQLCWAEATMPQMENAAALARKSSARAFRCQFQQASSSNRPITKCVKRWKIHRWQASSRSRLASRTAVSPSPSGGDN